MDNYTENRKILYVDDEQELLNSFTSLMRKENLQISTLSETKGITGVLNSKGPFAVVLSDMRMPGLDGVQVLETAKQKFPESIRVLVTGYADFNDTVRAINTGGITSYITKPWKDEEIILQVRNWVTQYNLKQQNNYLLNRLDDDNKKLNELLEGTLKGSIKVLVDILSLYNPRSFSRSNYLRNIGRNIANKLQLKNAWEIEIAILLSQIGCVGVPQEILEKKDQGLELTSKEESLYNSHPKIGQSIIKNIPRLEEVAEIISYQLTDDQQRNNTGTSKSNVPLSSLILKLLIDFDYLVSNGKSENDAVEILKQKNKYNGDLIIGLELEIAGMYDGLTIVKKELKDIKEGNVLAGDIKDTGGNVIIKRGNEISNVALVHLQNYSASNKIVTPILILE
ncbi:MAG: HD domain-containing phosphohydrolase [Ignavibacteriaceae bacterium]